MSPKQIIDRKGNKTYHKNGILTTSIVKIKNKFQILVT